MTCTILRRLCLFLLLASGLATAANAAPPTRGPVVLAAASLQESMTAIADAWVGRGHPRPILSFAGSQALARQIRAGAPADLFISADEEWMDAIAQEGLLAPGSRAVMTGNRLVLIAPKDAAVTIRIGRGMPLARALGDGRLAMADPDSVPAGRYGKAALTTLGVWPSVIGRIARSDSVRGALALVERKEAPFGIVYATDARASGGVRVVGAFPPGSHPPIRYPLARLKTSSHAQAEPFRRFLLSGTARGIFARYGFTAR